MTVFNRKTMGWVMVLALAMTILLTGFGGKDETEVLQVVLVNPEGKAVGEATLRETNSGVLIHVRAQDLQPGKHALHIHEFGLCEGPEFTPAGGHFNPYNKEHGFENPKGPHAGDLPNVYVTPQGTLEVEVLAHQMTLKKGKKNSLVRKDGSTLIMHAMEDDYRTNPAGNAGARVVCGVISPKEMEKK